MTSQLYTDTESLVLFDGTLFITVAIEVPLIGALTPAWRCSGLCNRNPDPVGRHIMSANRFQPSCEKAPAQTIVTRNLELARFAANPHAYFAGEDLLALMSQYDNSPTGRYNMLDQGFAGIPPFFKINKSTDTSLVKPKRRKRRRY